MAKHSWEELTGGRLDWRGLIGFDENGFPENNHDVVGITVWESDQVFTHEARIFANVNRYLTPFFDSFYPVAGGTIIKPPSERGRHRLAYYAEAVKTQVWNDCGIWRRPKSDSTHPLTNATPILP